MSYGYNKPFMPGRSQVVTVSNTSTTVALLCIGSPNFRVANGSSGTVTLNFGLDSTVTEDGTGVPIFSSQTAVFTKPAFAKTTHVAIRGATPATSLVWITEGEGGA